VHASSVADGAEDGVNSKPFDYAQDRLQTSKFEVLNFSLILFWWV
jgi:hypothetical protein